LAFLFPVEQELFNKEARSKRQEARYCEENREWKIDFRGKKQETRYCV
jgi:hypothetical protein